jgi:hypothetical protein
VGKVRLDNETPYTLQEENVMSRRVMMIGLLAISAVALFATHANAQSIAGWGFRCCSEITGIIELEDVPDPDRKSTVVTIDGSLNFIEVICRSPDGKHVSRQHAGSRVVKVADAIDNDEITKKGRATVEIKFGSPELAAAERKTTCEHPKWRVVPGSAAPRRMALTLQEFRCQPKSEEDPQPCFRHDTATLIVGKKIDTVHLDCALKKIRRDGDFIPLHDQEFTCDELVFHHDRSGRSHQ